MSENEVHNTQKPPHRAAHFRLPAEDEDLLAQTEASDAGEELREEEEPEQVASTSVDEALVDALLEEMAQTAASTEPREAKAVAVVSAKDLPATDEPSTANEPAEEDEPVPSATAASNPFATLAYVPELDPEHIPEDVPHENVPDPFVSQEDPYPYASALGVNMDGDDGGYRLDAGDTGDFLAAALKSKSSLAQHGAYGTNPTDTSVYYDVERYRSARKGGQRHKGLLIALTVLFLAVISVATAAMFYIANIDSRLTKEVTVELREELEEPKQPDQPFYLLLLGIDKDQSRWEGSDSADYGADEHAYRSDSIMLCRIDPVNVKVAMVSIHRDTLVDLGEHGKQKINAAYAFGGSAYATHVVSDFAGVPIAHYAEIDLDRFINVVEQVGGVTVDLPVPVYDPQYTGLDLPAGEQTLNGTEAALLCRCRHGYDAYGDGDKFRAANQRMVFSAVIKKVLSNPALMASTITTMADSVTTDLTVAKILDLATQMQTLNVDTDISTGMEPTDGVLIDEVWYEMCLTDEWEKMMSRVEQGLPPYDEAEGEHDSTAGIAGGVGEEGKRAEQAAIAEDAEEARALAEAGYVG